jgi:uncharacterized damage-inducible protein DinB
MTDAVAALAAVLGQLAGFVGALTDGQYTRVPGPGLSPIGGHVRHNLDHVAALLAGVRTGRLDYDHRDRTSAVGTDRTVALAAAARLRDELLAVRWDEAPDWLRLTALPAPDAAAVDARTTPLRELLFVASHTVHHNALIAVLARLVGAEPPAGFGYAPSTLAHLRSRPCVR